MPAVDVPDCVEPVCVDPDCVEPAWFAVEERDWLVGVFDAEEPELLEGSAIWA